MRVSELHRVTEAVDLDEPCFGVVDADMQTEDLTNTAIHRYRLTYVVRGDAMATHVTDLTDAGWYSHLEARPPAMIMAVGDLEAGTDTVASCWDQLEAAVYGRDHVVKRLAELQEESAKDKNIIHERLRRQDILTEYARRNRRTVASVERAVKDANG